MRRTVAAALAIAALMGGCSSAGSPVSGDPTSSASADVAEHESGPQSPITFGFFVPTGATQLGPLVRFRTIAVIDAFQGDLRAAMAARAINDARSDVSDNPDGVPLATPPTPPAVAQPSDDTFAELDDPPKPDVTVSFMRVDRNPTTVVRRMARQIAAIVPDAGIQPDNLASYCTIQAGLVAACQIAVAGSTPDGTAIAVHMSIRAAPDGQRPVMSLIVRNTGDPRIRVRETETIDLDENLPPLENAPSWAVDTAASTAPSLPANARELLSGSSPSFATAVTLRGREAQVIAEAFATADGRRPVKDVLEELNEVRTTYTAVTRTGLVVGTYVLSARGNYVMLMTLPAI